MKKKIYSPRMGVNSSYGCKLWIVKKGKNRLLKYYSPQHFAKHSMQDSVQIEFLPDNSQMPLISDQCCSQSLTKLQENG